MNKEEAYILAVVGGDGTLYYREKKEYKLFISDKCQTYHKILQKFFRNIFNFTTTISFIKQRNTFYTIVRNKKIVEYFLQYYPAGKIKTKNCRVPRDIFNSDRLTKLYHLSGWIDSEGYPKLQKTTNYIYPRVLIETISKDLIDDIYKLSLEVGIFSTKPHICKRNYKENRKIRYGIEWNGKKCQKLIPYMLHDSKLRRLSKYISLQGGQIKGFT